MEVENGLLSDLEQDNINEQDYLWNVEAVYPDPKVPSRSNLVEVNQWTDKETTSACTIASTLWSVCTNLGLSEQFYQDNLKPIWKLAQKAGAKQPGGWYFASAVDLIRKYVNLNKKMFGLDETDELVSERSTRYSDLPWELMKKWYMIVWGFKGDSVYSKDKRDNGVINWKKFGFTYWHAVAYTKRSDKLLVSKNPETRDSYKGTAFNQYTYDHFMDLVKGWTVYPSCYFFYVKSNKTADDLEIEEAIKMWITNGKDIYSTATRQQVILMCIRTLKLAQK